MDSRLAFDRARARDADRSCGSLRLPIDLSAPAVPNHLVVPTCREGPEIHVVLTVVDKGEPPLARYGRVVMRVSNAPK
jgi:hypothetical protein